MLPKENRLSNESDFERVKQKGNKVSGKGYIVLFKKRKDKEPARFGIVVSKKISKKAVDRNKAKRTVRESIRGILGKVGSGYDIVIITRKNVLAFSFNEARNDLVNIFKKARLI